MHYRNGREAKNGDIAVKLSTSWIVGGIEYPSGKIIALGVLHSAVPGNDHCNGSLAPLLGDSSACLCDMIHVDDLAAILTEKGLDKRPAGK